MYLSNIKSIITCKYIEKCMSRSEKKWEICLSNKVNFTVIDERKCTSEIYYSMN